jgi:ligand-binding sensor domain-containing protein/two-component sensor histidine kinase
MRFIRVYAQSLIFILVTGFPMSALAQVGREAMRHIGLEDGLSSNHATCFHEDFQGFMWIGTNEGLCRFDGKNFYNYFQNPKDPIHSLSGNWINYITSYENYLFIATNHGISVFNLLTQEFCNDYFGDNRYNYTCRELFNFIVNLNNKWYLGGESSLFELHTDLSFSSDISALIKSTTNAVARDFLEPSLLDNSHILFASCGELFEYKSSSNFIITSTNNQFKSPGPFVGSCHTARPLITENGTYYFQWASNPIYTADDLKREIRLRGANPVYDGSTNHWLHDKNNCTWFATESGLFRSSPNHIIQEIPLDSELSLSCYNVIQDKSNNIWIATNNGVYHTYDSHANWQVTALPEVFTKKKAYVQDLTWWQNAVWFNTTETNTASIHSLRDGQITTFPIQNFDNVVRSIHPLDEQRLFVGGWTNSRIVNANDMSVTDAGFIPKEFQSYSVIKSMNDRSGGTWLSFGQGNGILYSPHNSSPIHFALNNTSPDTRSIPIANAYDMIEDDEGLIWMVRSKLDGRIVYWNPKTGQFNEIHPENPEAVNMNYNGESYCIASDGSAIWFAVMREGLFRYDKTSNTIEQFTRNDGLLSNDIYTLEVDKNGTVWMGTSLGLAAMSYPEITVTHFTESSGLPDQNFSAASLYVSSIDRMFFSAHGHLLSFSPTELLKPAIIPELYLTGIKVEGKESGILPREFTPGENHIDFHFTAVDLYQATGFEYRYRLEGLETEWNYSEKNNYASYANIPAGDYALMVCVKTLGEWSEPRTLYTFSIPSYYYKTWWFYTLLALLFCLLLYSIYILRMRRVKHLESIRNRISRDLHDDIGSALSSIRILSGQRKIEQHQMQDALGRINRSSQQMLDNMDDIVWAIQTGNDLGEHLLIRMREFASEVIEAGGMSCSLQLDERIERRSFEINQKRTIYLIFKEAVNNAVKYSKGQEIKIRFEINTKGNLELEVSDNGEGFDRTVRSNGNGLLNMQSRANELNGQLKINSIDNLGTTVTLLIPKS